MTWYAYTARSAGRPVTGALEGDSATAVADQLLARGIAPLDIEPLAGNPAKAWRLDQPLAMPRWLLPKVTQQDLMLFSRQLHTLLRSGVPILRALAGLQDSAVNVRFREVLAELRRSLESGIELSMGLAQHQPLFSGFYIAMVRVGEMTGRLDDVLKRMAEQIEFEMFMRQQVKSALRYPMFVIVAMVLAIGVINLLVIPAFADIFKSFGAELPLVTRGLILASRLTIDWGWAAALATGVGLVVWARWKRTPDGQRQWDAFCLRLPLVGKIVRKATLARFARSMALAMKSGLPIEQTLTVTAQTVGNQFIARKVEAMREAVERGDTILRAAVASGVFTPIVLQMIAVGEETGAVDELMDEIAQLYTGEVQYELKTLTQQIEPILILMLGVMVLLLALGVFLPMWDLGQAAFKK